MFGRRTTPQGYNRAIEDCKKLTQRLRCINKALKKPPTPIGIISDSLRKRVCEALDNHIANCEGAET